MFHLTSASREKCYPEVLECSIYFFCLHFIYYYYPCKASLFLTNFLRHITMNPFDWNDVIQLSNSHKSNTFVLTFTLVPFTLQTGTVIVFDLSAYTSSKFRRKFHTRCLQLTTVYLHFNISSVIPFTPGASPHFRFPITQKASSLLSSFFS